jgi:cytochrome c2
MRRSALLGWQSIAGLISLVLLPTVWGKKALWTLDAKSLAILGLAAAAYLVAVFVLRTATLRGQTVTLRQVLVVSSAAFLPVVLVVLVFHPGFSRFATVAVPVLGAGLLAWIFWIQDAPNLRLLAVAVLALAAIVVHVGFATGRIGRPKLVPERVRTVVDSSLYEVEIVSHRYVVPRPFAQQGGLTLFGDRYLLATGDGDLYVFSRPAGADNLKPERLPYEVPLNAAEFTTAMKGVPVSLAWFRVADVFAQSTAGGLRLYASHHFWKTTEKCFVMRISMLEGTEAQFLARPAQLKWETLFETTPCLAVTAPGKAPYFEGLENGGRMALLNEHQMLFTVGDHAFDGLDTEVMAAQDPAMSYGKIVLIDLKDRSSRIFSSGHRNPQGLFVSASGLIWSTEHGPQGGDELNLERDGANYGWPLATYGTDYGTHTWPLTAVPGAHEGKGFTQPYFSWIPSIGISALVELNGSQFKYWQGDLLVGSLINRKLWRVRVRDNRVVLAEPIPIGERIRAMVQGHQGELVLWTDRESIMFVAPAPETAENGGRQLYRTCAACHVPQPGQESAIGPSLEGVVGRRVATIEGFDYSPAMKAAGGRWTEQRLDEFLVNPGAAIQGTTMMFPGIPDADTRRKIIVYLASPTSDLGPVPGGGDR